MVCQIIYQNVLKTANIVRKIALSFCLERLGLIRSVTCDCCQGKVQSLIKIYSHRYILHILCGSFLKNIRIFRGNFKFSNILIQSLNNSFISKFSSLLYYMNFAFGMHFDRSPKSRTFFCKRHK